MANVYQLPSEAQPARKRRRTCRGRHCIGKVERQVRFVLPLQKHDWRSSR
jgi:hypothetical protein